MSRSLYRRAVTASVALAACASIGWGGPTSAVPADPIIAGGRVLASPVAADGSKITGVAVTGPRSISLQVYSAAMTNIFTVNVQRPADVSRPRPTLYLLNGGGGGLDSATWQARTDALTFLSDKNVNVVQPIGGRWSYYTDWRAPDPRLGVNMWKTFLTAELPPLIDAALGANGINAIAGLSTSGTSVLALPIAKPGLYKAAAAYSGCAQISDPLGQEYVKLSVETWGGGNTVNMYGPLGDPMWAANDPYLHADALRGLSLYLSSGTGMPGRFDVLNGPYAQRGPTGLVNQVLLGGIIEAAVNYCTHNLQSRLTQLNIPATFDFPPDGTHSWGYWQEELKRSWPVLARGLGLP